MSLTDCIRGAYPPYWKGDDPGRFPTDVLWQNSEGHVPFELGDRDCRWTRKDYIDHVLNGRDRHAPVAPHWRALIDCTATSIA